MPVFTVRARFRDPFTRVAKAGSSNNGELVEALPDPGFASRSLRSACALRRVSSRGGGCDGSQLPPAARCTLVVDVTN
jgi:hypothetical protein